MSKGPSGSWSEVLWPANKAIKAFYTTRTPVENTTDHSCYASFNLATHVGDELNSVLAKRKELRDGLNLPAEPVWLEQVHGVEIYSIDSKVDSSVPVADGSFTVLPGAICCVMTADCLPVLLTNKEGSWVSAIHAGWRGLADGILQKAVALYHREPEEIIAWLGPAISQKHFEVGSEVRDNFVQQNIQFEKAFIATENSKFMADLYLIARIILQDAGVAVYGGNFCTYHQESDFYSYRRDGETGRMASLIWIDSQVNSK